MKMSKIISIKIPHDKMPKIEISKLRMPTYDYVEILIYRTAKCAKDKNDT